MKKKDEKPAIQHSIYRLNINRLKFRLDEKPIKKGDYINRSGDIVKLLCRNLEVCEDDTKEMKENIYYSFRFKNNKIAGLFLYKYSKVNIEQLNEFFSSILVSFPRMDQHKMYSTIMFLWTDRNIYAITTGYARYDISAYIEPHFGLKILSAYKNIINVRSQSINPLHGLIHEDTQKFSSPVPVSCIISSNSLLSKISGFVSKESELHDGLELPSRKKLQVYARDHIRLSQKLSFSDLCSVISHIDAHDNNRDEFNLVGRVDEDVCKFIADNISDEHNNDTIYIYPQDDDSFDLSEEWTINYNNREKTFSPKNLKQIYKEYQEEIKRNEDAKLFFQDAIICFNKDGGKKHKLLETLNGEIQKNKVVYTLIYGKFYQYKEQLLKRISKDLDARLKDNENNDARFIKKLDFSSTKNEDEIVCKICELQQSYPFHKIICNNIEFADVLVEKDNIIYLVHVKCYFNNSMRDLQKQMELSTQMLRDIKSNSNSILLESLWREINASTEKRKNAYEKRRADLNTCFLKGIKNKDALKDYLCLKEIKYIALIACNYKINHLSKARSITAMLCLEKLISFFNNEDIPLIVQTIQWEKAATKA